MYHKLRVVTGAGNNPVLMDLENAQGWKMMQLMSRLLVVREYFRVSVSANASVTYAFASKTTGYAHPPAFGIVSVVRIMTKRS